MKNQFIEECSELLNGLPDCTGDMARLAHRLSESNNRLQRVQDALLEMAKEGITLSDYLLAKGRARDLLEEVSQGLSSRIAR